MLLFCQGVSGFLEVVLYGGVVYPGRTGVEGNYTETQSRKIATKGNSNLCLIVSEQL